MIIILLSRTHGSQQPCSRLERAAERLGGAVDERVALVTGAASGIGRATAELLASRGFRVVVADVDAAGGESVVAAIRAVGGIAMFAETDMRVTASIERLVSDAVTAYGRIDLLHNNAGLMFMRDGIADVSEEEWRLLLDVMLTGAFIASRAVFPIMREQGGGLIVNTASRASWDPLPWGIPYATAKSGLLGFSRSLASAGQPFNIRSVAVCPGAVRTSLQRHVTAAHLRELDQRGWIAPQQVAELVLYLLECPGITGAEILIEDRGGRVYWGRSRATEFTELPQADPA
jgi:3-oxoacyl-[acyl-carrier protein] reductase